MFTDLVSGYELLLYEERCNPPPLPHECILTVQIPCLCIRRRLSHMSPVFWGHFCSRAVRHFGTPCINTLAIESCQILHWVSLPPLHLSFSPKEHESTEVQMSWYYFCGQLRTLPKLLCDCNLGMWRGMGGPTTDNPFSTFLNKHKWYL